jgi:hypothetical protein
MIQIKEENACVRKRIFMCIQIQNDREEQGLSWPDNYG